MKITVDQSMFRDAFQRYDRIDNFSYQGLNALFDYLEEVDAESGEETELDVIAICSDFSEHDSALIAAQEYSSFEVDPDLDEDEQEAAALEFLEDNTTVIQVDGGSVIVAGF